MKINPWYIIVLILVFGAGIYIGKSNKEVVIDEVVDKEPVSYKVDSIKYSSEEVILPDEEVDTDSVVQEFYTERSFDTIINVSNEVELKVGGIVFENRLRNLDFSVANFRPTKIVKPDNWVVSAGMTFGNDVAAPMIFAEKGKHEVGVGYNVVNKGGIMVSYKYRLFDF